MRGCSTSTLYANIMEKDMLTSRKKEYSGKLFEMFPRHDRVATISESFAFHLIISVLLANE